MSLVKAGGLGTPTLPFECCFFVTQPAHDCIYGVRFLWGMAVYNTWLYMSVYCHLARCSFLPTSFLNSH